MTSSICRTTSQRDLLKIPAEYSVLFLQGGASLQFYMTALNMWVNDTGAYINTGTWSTGNQGSKTVRASIYCLGTIRWHFYPRTFDKYTVPDDAVYLHYTSNNTIYGTQFHECPEANIPLIGIILATLLPGLWMYQTRIIYAGAQKNLGPSGVTAVILSPWAVERSRSVNTIREGGLPSMLNYGLMVDKTYVQHSKHIWYFCIGTNVGWLIDKAEWVLFMPKCQ